LKANVRTSALVSSCPALCRTSTSLRTGNQNDVDGRDNPRRLKRLARP
jgi:hypothetical protein